MPTVSVIIPVRDGAQYVGEALQSILDQDLADIEVIVVDDGSSDDSAAIATSLGDRDGRVKIVANRGKGIVDALNMGISLARAPLVARMDCDDVSLPDRLRLQVACFDADADLQLLGTAGLQIDRGGKPLRPMDVPIGDEQLRDALARYNPMLHPTVMFRAEAVRRAGGYRRAFTYAEDYDLWLRLSETGKLANMDARLVKLRSHPGQVSRMKEDQQKAAAALARQSALLRRSRAEPFDANGQPAQAIGAFLAWRAATGVAVSGLERRDIELLLRTAGIPLAITCKLLFLAAVGAPSFRTLALGPRLAWRRMTMRPAKMRPN
ncbi:glycosyltransferase [Mesorhizobium australafricanum]|uniref:Glycosyltransferase n=1 Tax=Mesorhizobium australafricanum TaxID=3072311 RepID=A0ABU4WRS4_9HYPH|nr:glycosyltransferase [Mesorhizobium sp. VK3E]MDX8438216.1 glycosyltransferase [Mesorhizobium sp. VK3E]